MAKAICSNCKNVVSWFGGKGTDISKLTSHCCGAPLQGMTTGKQSANKGKKYEYCVACGRRGLVDLQWKYKRIVHPNVDFMVWWNQGSENKVFPRGSPVHAYHSIFPTGMTWGFFLDLPEDKRIAFEKEIKESPLDKKD
jgi:hypothetical protein